MLEGRSKTADGRDEAGWLLVYLPDKERKDSDADTIKSRMTPSPRFNHALRSQERPIRSL